GQGPHPHLALRPHRARLAPGRGPGRPPARDPRHQRRAIRGGPAGGARAPPPRGGRADRRRAGDDEGRGDEARAGHVLPRRRPRARGAPRGVPAQARGAARRGTQGALRRHAQGDRVRARRPAGGDLRRVRSRADRRGLDRPGLSRPPAPAGRRDDRPAGGGQGPVPGRRPGRTRRPAEHRADPAPGQAGRARAGCPRERRRDPRAHRRGARLRAGGPEPALAGAHLQGAPVHPRARCRHRALAREGHRVGVRLRRGLRHRQGDGSGHSRPRRRDRLPLLRRLHVPPPPVLRRPASRQLPAHGGRQGGLPRLRPLQDHAQGAAGARDGLPARGPRGRRRAAAPDVQRDRLHRRSRALPPRQAARPVPRRDLVVPARRGDRADARDRHPGDDRHVRSALAALRADAPPDAARRPHLRPPRRDAHPRRPLAAAGARELASRRARVALRGAAGHRAGARRGAVLRRRRLV
ncbi:MAG: ABC1 family protein, partial [uncultured Solirubrobacteraceae bacterium]